ncbi:DUF7260 family protein [Halopiger goleimassiliensis]|uniref:DUF7260 family protein n=1 Tax=Halopiger goleimassiliensis TaxID=1293048 RepID=UPI000677A5FC|nr:hypothetical protein [Halopiger goleimassiliensis]
MTDASPTTTILEPAIAVLEREREEVLAERRAFDRFASRVADLDARPASATAQFAGPGAVTHVSSTGNDCSAVREAFDETVMSLSHYSDRYDETWIESIAAELNPDVAAALQRHERLHPPLKRSLQLAAEQAVTNRTELLDLLETERDALAEYESELSDAEGELQSLLDQPISNLEFNALRLTRTRLEELGDRCDRLATERQRQLHERRCQLSVIDGDVFEAYLYGNYEHSYPVLAAITLLADRIESSIADVDRLLVRSH